MPSLMIWRRSADYRAVFEGPTGQRVLGDILSKGGVGRRLNGGDSHNTAVNVGRYELAIEIATLLNLRPDELAALAKESYYDEDDEAGA